EVVVDSPANGEGMSPRVAQTLLELLIDQALGLTQLQDQPELKNKFIHDLLRGPLREEEDILREGQILGMDFTRPRAVILINAADYILATPKAEIGDIDIGEAQIRRRAQSVISS